MISNFPRNHNPVTNLLSPKFSYPHYGHRRRVTEHAQPFDKALSLKLDDCHEAENRIHIFRSERWFAPDVCDIALDMVRARLRKLEARIPVGGLA